MIKPLHMFNCAEDLYQSKPKGQEGCHISYTVMNMCRGSVLVHGVGGGGLNSIFAVEKGVADTVAGDAFKVLAIMGLDAAALLLQQVKFCS
jgi:hypothetical protein